MTKEEREYEIAKLYEWINKTEGMLEEIGTVPVHMRKIYENSLSESKNRLYDLMREGAR